jgi:folate-binding protein YgfZ
MRSLPLREQHLSHNALLGERDGVEVAMAYGDTFTEYKAATEAVALLDRSDRAVLRLEGSDRVNWLHGMTTNDVKNLPIGQGQRTTLCNAKGKVIGLGYLTQRADDILLDLDPLCREGAFASLERLLITEDVTITDETGLRSLLTLVGPGAETQLQEFFSELPVAPNSYVNCEYAGKQVWIRKSRVGVLPAFDLWVEGGELFEWLASRVPLLGWQATELIRIEGGEPRYGQDVTDATIPQEAGLDNAISFEKGCYLGQETIARLHFRGHVNRNLRLFYLEDGHIPDIGAPITINGEEKGKVTSACLSPQYKIPICLGYIRREFAEAGQKVSVQTQAGQSVGEVRLLPFS